MPRPARTLEIAILVATFLVPALSWSGEERDAQTWFFEGLDMKEAGDCAGAVARFQMALAQNPEMHQARLYLAECFLEVGMPTDAVRELGLYLDADFPGAEIDHACEMLRGAGGDHADCRGKGPRWVPLELPPEVAWAPVTVELGLVVEHFENRVGLTAAGPWIGGRFLVWRWIEVHASVGFAVAPPPLGVGRIEVPTLMAGVAFSAPLGPLRLFAGLEVPAVISRLDLAMRVDAGIMGMGGARFAIPVTRLVVGGQIGGGWVVSPVFIGGIFAGVQLGPRTGGE